MMKLLIAEDDRTSRLVLQKTLEHLGHQCYPATDGAEAWRLFVEHSPDVVIADWNMPGIDGVDLCRRIRESQKDQGYTYFIFLTALTDKEHARQGMAAGADDYLKKPFDRADLELRLVAAERVTALHQKLAHQKDELEKMNRLFYLQARHDPLTQLGNRLRLREDMEKLRACSARYGHTYALALCDIDHFKKYNDFYGHPAGDEVLQMVAHTLSTNCRSEDGVYRVGGEEFLLVLPEQALENAAIAVDRMREALFHQAIPHNALNPAGVLTFSGGVAAQERGEPPRDLATLLRAADRALYLAKRSGRNRVVAWQPAHEALEIPASSHLLGTYEVMGVEATADG